MNRAIVFMFPSNTPLSVNAIAACAKAICVDTGANIENMIAKQLDEDAIASQIACGLRVGDPEIVVESKNAALAEALKYISDKFQKDLSLYSNDMISFAGNLASYISTISFTKADNLIKGYLEVIKNSKYTDLPSKTMLSMGISKKAFEVIQRIAQHV